MSSIVLRLARWARDLQPGDLPPSVEERVRLQHLSMAGAVRSMHAEPVADVLRRAGGTRGAATLVTGGTAPRRDAVRLHAGLGGYIEYDDHLVFGSTGAAATAAAWASARRHTVAELITATAAANEVAGRIGASLLVGPAHGQGVAVVHAAAAAVASGLLDGLDADQLAHALALAISTPQRMPWRTLLGGGMGKALVVASPAVQGVDAVDLARAGMAGPLDILDAGDGLLGTLCWAPLRNAFTGLGTAWLSRTLSYRLMPGATPIQVPVQQVWEILRRHVKAADKRLRADQVDRIHIKATFATVSQEQLAQGHGGLDPASIPYSVKRSIGVLLVAQELGPEQLRTGWLESEKDRIAEVASKVEIEHDWVRTWGFVEHLVEVAAPLLAGLTRAELRTAGLRASGTYGSPGMPAASELLTLLRHRPDQLMEKIRYASGDLADARLDEWQYRLGSEVRLYTTRGGSWPDRRDLPEGSPGWPWQQTVDGVHRKFAAGEDARAERVASVGAMDGGADAEAWVGELLG